MKSNFLPTCLSRSVIRKPTKSHGKLFNLILQRPFIDASYLPDKVCLNFSNKFRRFGLTKVKAGVKIEGAFSVVYLLHSQLFWIYGRIIMSNGVQKAKESTSRRSNIRSLVFKLFLAVGLAVIVVVPCKDWHVRANDLFVSPFGDDLGGANDCTSPDQPCRTIQHAINQASSGDLIELAPGTYTENVTVSQNVTIQGDFLSGATVNGNNTGPVFVINSMITATLSNLTITNGNAGSASNEGGGIQNNGGTLTVTGCTINGNTAGSSSPAGGGIFNGTSSTLTVINSTIQGNTAIGGDGGGVANQASATFVNATISGNGANAGGGIANTVTGTLNLTNTIIAGSTGGGDCNNSGTLGTNDHNLIQDGSCSPLISGDPKLGPLQNNGGPTFTQALQIGSPAIDAGDDAVLGDPLDLQFDQRGFGFPRKACQHVDIGAYEFASNAPPMVNCPINKAAFTDPGQTTATVSFAATATDLCDGTLTPTYKIGATTITSPHAFPAGVTTVTVSATDSAMLTGMCSFTVTVTQLNICIQDDHSGDTFRFNSQTGQYVYTRCKDKFTLTGTGTVKTSGSQIQLTDSKPDRQISAGYLTSQKTGRANIVLIKAPGVSQTIVVNQTNPFATCQCPS